MEKKDRYIEARLWGLLQLLGLGAFLYGFFFGNKILVFLGAGIMLFEEFIGITEGAIRPGPFFFFAVIGAIVAPLIGLPWYLGIFWVEAIGGIIDFSTNIRKIFNPEWFARKQLEIVKSLLDETGEDGNKQDE